MDFTLTPEPVYSAVDILQTSSEQPVDLDFTLPDYCADIEKVFKCTVTPEVYSTSVVGGQLSVEGANIVRVLYCSTDKKRLRCAEQTLPFSASFNLDPDCTDCVVSVKAKSEYINCKALSKRRMSIHGAVSLNVRVRVKKSSMVYMPDDNPLLQTDIHKMTVSELLSMESDVFSVNETISTDAKSPVSSILRSEVKINLTDTTPVGNRVLLKGEVTLCVLYATDADRVAPEQLTYVFPFVHNMECAESQNSTFRDTELNLLSYDIKLKTDVGTDTPVILLEARICATVSCRKETEVKYIGDAYSTCTDTELEYTSLTIDTAVIPKTSSVMAKSELDFGDTQIKGIIDIFCDNVVVKPLLTESLRLEGKANFCILGLNEDSELVYLERSIDISHSENLEYGFTRCTDVCVMIKSLSYRLTDSNSLELRAEVSILSKLLKNEHIHAVSAVTDCGAANTDDDCALTLYYADGGEKIWDISKRYRTDRSALCRENGISGEVLEDKMLLLIPKM